MELQTFNGPDVQRIVRFTGIAGQFGFRVQIKYPDEMPRWVAFYGNVYGTPGPVVIEIPGLGQMFVSDPGRHGSALSPSWIRSFYGATS